MELKMATNAELKNKNKLVQYLFKKEDRVHKLIISLLILSLIAGIETTLLLYSADQKGMNVLNGMSISEIGALSFAINTIVMGALGLLVTFIIQILIVCLLFLVLKERPVNIKGVCQAVINAGVCIVIDPVLMQSSHYWLRARKRLSLVYPYWCMIKAPSFTHSWLSLSCFTLSV